jgi:hypothetical protein
MQNNVRNPSGYNMTDKELVNEILKYLRVEELAVKMEANNV